MGFFNKATLQIKGFHRSDQRESVFVSSVVEEVWTYKYTGIILWFNFSADKL